MNIVVLDGYALNPGDLGWEAFKAEGNLTVYDRSSPEETAARIGGAEAVLTNKTVLSRAILDQCPGLKYIGVLATGYNVVDMKAAKARGITVTNVPGYSTASVAQTVFALLLEICLHVGEHNRAVQEGRWIRSRDFSFWDHPLLELDGKTFGIIGLGTIGKAAAKIARAFGMEVIAYSRSQTEAGKAAAAYHSLDEVLARSDVLSLHCSANTETVGIINKHTIAKMKDGAILINTSRGTLVAEADLAAALESGKLSAAGLDVVSEEPMKAENPLLGAKNCLITPHFAWATLESRKRCVEIAARNLKSCLAGNPLNVVS